MSYYCSLKFRMKGSETVSKCKISNSGVGDLAKDSFSEKSAIFGEAFEIDNPLTEDELEEVTRLESGQLPHERIHAAVAEKTAISEQDKDTFVDPELSEEDIITEHDESKDMRYKASQRELTDKEVSFIVRYYQKKDSIRNIIVDFEDALSENILKLGKELLSQGFVWAAEEARSYLRNLRIDLPMCDLDMIHAAFRYVEKDQPRQVRAIIDRFSESRNLDGSRVLGEKTIDNLETLLNLCNN